MNTSTNLGDRIKSKLSVTARKITTTTLRKAAPYSRPSLPLHEAVPGHDSYFFKPKPLSYTPGQPNAEQVSVNEHGIRTREAKEALLQQFKSAPKLQMFGQRPV